MNIFKKVWRFVDGNKSAIGGAMMLIGAKLPLLFPQTAPIAGSIGQVGEWILGGGLVHKGLKATPNDYLPKMLKTFSDPNGSKIGEPPPYKG